jgi:hypothetical protein
MFCDGPHADSYTEFERIIVGCRKVFSAWEEDEERFRTALRDHMRRARDETKALRRGAPDHKNLHDRIDELGM